MLVRLVGLNIAFDVLSIPFWIALPSLQTAQSTASTLTVNSTIAIVDAAIAASLFALSFFGISKKQKWGYYLAIITTIIQRAVGVFLFALNIGMAFEVIWSIVMIYFAFKATMTTQTPPKPS
jgi:hypothetical protein